MADVRIALFGLQPDLDRDFLEVLGRQPALADLGADAQHVLLADVEIHVDRIDLHDGGQHGRRGAAADIGADRDLARGDDAVEGRGHVV